MNLLERYLIAVGEHLPARGRADMLAELRVNLEAEIEGREEELGRALTEAEVAQVLEAHGMPVLVAARYGPQQFLIGPGLFPFYWYTLKRSFPYVVAIYALVQITVAIIASGSGPDLGQRIGAAFGHFPAVALTFWSVMTLGFAAFEFAQGRYVPKMALPKWSANDLPAADSTPQGKSTANIVADLIVSVLIVVWLLAVPDHPYLVIGPGAELVNGLPFGLTPEWHVFYWQIVGLLIAMLPFKVLMVLPNLRRWRRHIDLVISGMGILILVIMVQVRQYFVAGAQITSENLHSLAGINAGISFGFKVALAISAVKFCWDVWKVMSSGQAQRAGYVAVK
jgi:hypothetical protein